jgi:hypothetical protein
LSRWKDSGDKLEGCRSPNESLAAAPRLATMDGVEASFMKTPIWLLILLTLTVVLVPARTVTACPS